MQTKQKQSEYIDCVALKRQIQERLWNELQPTSADDYFDKLQVRMGKSKFMQQVIQKHKKHIKVAA